MILIRSKPWFGFQRNILLEFAYFHTDSIVFIEELRVRLTARRSVICEICKWKRLSSWYYSYNIWTWCRKTIQGGVSMNAVFFFVLKHHFKPWNTSRRMEKSHQYTNILDSVFRKLLSCEVADFIRDVHSCQNKSPFTSSGVHTC